MPAEQVLRAPVRPQQRHVHHHQHLSSTTLRLRVAVGVRVVSASHPVRLRAVSRPPARGPVAMTATHPGVVFRDQVWPAVAATAAGLPAWPPVPLVRAVSPPAAPARTNPAARAASGALPPVELVHRMPAPQASGAAASRPADARVNGTAARPGPRWADLGRLDLGRPDLGRAAAAGAAPLTAADVPGVVDQVVREIDRRVVAARERRGWTA
jgi:hypothetical protein